MCIWVSVSLLVLGLSPASAEPPVSPRIAALAAAPATMDAFWERVTAEGTPLVEDINDPKGRLLVTFVYRATPGLSHVAVYQAPGGNSGYAQLKQVVGTDVFAWSTLVDPATRFTYSLAPGDNYGPPATQSDFEKRLPLFRPDLLNKHPYNVDASLVELPNALAQPGIVPKRETQAGELVVHKARSKALGNERSVIVYTPPQFSTPGPKYPLVVMFDASAAVNALAIPVVLDELIAAKKIPPIVVMLIGNVDRSKELPGDAAFADFIALDLVPWVRRAYHATTDSRLTVLAGISYGGLAATYAAARHPAVYGNVLSQSGSYWWSPDDIEEGEAHPRDYARRPRLPVRFWMEVGTLEVGSPKRATDQLGSNRHMRDILVARGYDVTYREFVGAHEYINWRGTIGEGLVALLTKPPRLEGKPPASPGKAGGLEIDAGRKSIIPIVQRTALLDGGVSAVAKLKQLNAEYVITEAAINTAGYTLLTIGHAPEALPLFVWNVERFPQSAGAYDSLAEAYYCLGDRADAVATYKKSLELDPKNDNAKKMIELLH
jgi:enterochelin esterase family protein